MANDNSFDIVSEVNLQEVDNAINQALKEALQRFDLKDSKSSIVREERQIAVRSVDDFKLRSVVEILQGRLVKRHIPLKALQFGKIEPAAGGTARQVIDLQVGIPKEKAHEIVKLIKKTKLKVQASIQDDQVRVSGRNKDDLQAIIKMLNDAPLGIAMQFVNYR